MNKALKNSGIYDVIIIGAGAAGLMCAITAGGRGRRVLVLDHAQKIGEKIRISGGGRCNFTNIHTRPAAYISQNPHFCKSALSRYTPQDFIALVRKHGIKFHEKKLGQLFCDDSAQNIIDMLLNECQAANVTIKKDISVKSLNFINDAYHIDTYLGEFIAPALVIATGGLSIPKIGATKFGYDVARQFGLNIIPTRAGLVPLTFQSDMLERCRHLTGLSVDALVQSENPQGRFAEGLLFTHRGLSGPSILQISSYWQEKEDIIINLCPEQDIFAFLKEQKTKHPKQEIQTVLSHILPKRLVDDICTRERFTGRIADMADKSLRDIAQSLQAWRVRPGGTEGYRTAEVTIGGVDTNELSSKTMESKKQAGLYFIGEAMDVTGHLGGYNFQWAWASGYAAGQNC